MSNRYIEEGGPTSISKEELEKVRERIEKSEEAKRFVEELDRKIESVPPSSSNSSSQVGLEPPKIEEVPAGYEEREIPKPTAGISVEMFESPEVKEVVRKFAELRGIPPEVAERKLKTILGALDRELESDLADAVGYYNAVSQIADSLGDQSLGSYMKYQAGKKVLDRLKEAYGVSDDISYNDLIKLAKLNILARLAGGFDVGQYQVAQMNNIVSELESKFRSAVNDVVNNLVDRVIKPLESRVRSLEDYIRERERREYEVQREQRLMSSIESKLKEVEGKFEELKKLYDEGRKKRKSVVVKRYVDEFRREVDEIKEEMKKLMERFEAKKDEESAKTMRALISRVKKLEEKLDKKIEEVSKKTERGSEELGSLDNLERLITKVTNIAQALGYRKPGDEKGWSITTSVEPLKYEGTVPPWFHPHFIGSMEALLDKVVRPILRDAIKAISVLKYGMPTSIMEGSSGTEVQMSEEERESLFSL